MINDTFRILRYRRDHEESTLLSDEEIMQKLIEAEEFEGLPLSAEEEWKALDTLESNHEEIIH